MTHSPDVAVAPSQDVYPSALRANYALTMLMVAYVLSFVDRQILALLIEPMKADLGLSDFQIGLVQGLAFAVFYTVMGIPIARLADNHSRRLVISVGIFFWSLMTASCGLAKNFTMLFMARMGVGLGEAALSPSAYSMLSDYFPPAKLARAVSIYSLGVSIGSGAAFLLGGMVLDLIEHKESLVLPFFGELKMWQTAFIAVALPGPLLVLLFATVMEPPRKVHPAPGSGGSLAAVNEAIPFKDVLRYLWGQRQFYGYHFGTMGFLAIVGMGTTLWLPTFYIRIYEQSPTDVGYQFGMVYLICGCLGTLFGGFAAQWLSQRHKDGNMRWVFIVAIVHLVPAIFTFLMPTYGLALAMGGVLTFVGTSYFPVGVAALQVVTPNRMRAQVSAILLFCSNIAGMAIGPVVIAFFTDFLFRDEMQLHYSLVTNAIVFLPIAIFLSYRAMIHYGKAVQGMNL